MTYVLSTKNSKCLALSLPIYLVYVYAFGNILILGISQIDRINAVDFV